MNDRHDPQRITWYFAQEKRTLAVVTVSGLLYNAGLLAGPLFEGRLVGTLPLQPCRACAASNDCMSAGSQMTSTGA